jgi:predicted peptidase
VIVIVYACVAQTAGVKTGQHVYTFEKEIQRAVHIQYLLYVPAAYGLLHRQWPLILYLHGGMGRGDDIERVMWYPVPRMLVENDTFPFIVVTPQCPSGEMWTDTDALIALLDEVMTEYSVDSNRVYLVGYSMGGHGAWYLAYKYPDRFAAVAPMSGMTNVWWASRVKGIPVWAFHGAQDTLVPVSETEEMVKILEKEGATARVSIDPERGHSPPSQREHEELFQWFLEQSRTGNTSQ